MQLCLLCALALIYASFFLSCDEYAYGIRVYYVLFARRFVMLLSYQPNCKSLTSNNKDMVFSQNSVLTLTPAWPRVIVLVLL